MVVVCVILMVNGFYKIVLLNLSSFGVWFDLTLIFNVLFVWEEWALQLVCHNHNKKKKKKKFKRFVIMLLF